jgi:hypothetical protein
MGPPKPVFGGGFQGFKADPTHTSTPKTSKYHVTFHKHNSGQSFETEKKIPGF